MNNKTYTIADGIINVNNTNISVQLSDLGKKLWGIKSLDHKTAAEKAVDPKQWQTLDKAATECYCALADAAALASAIAVRKNNDPHCAVSGSDKQSLRAYRQQAARAYRTFADLIGTRTVGTRTMSHALVVDESNVDFLYIDLHSNKAGRNCGYHTFLKRLWVTMQFLLSGGSYESIEEQKARMEAEASSAVPEKPKSTLQKAKERAEAAEKALEEAKKESEEREKTVIKAIKKARKDGLLDEEGFTSIMAAFNT